jgi:ABC-type branched-subunit amino acid transport system ATPase component
MGQQANLVCSDIEVRFGGNYALKRISCEFERGSIVGIIGPNGSGKTTLLNVISGSLKPNRGAVRLGERISGLPRELLASNGIFRSFQTARLFESLSGDENVGAALRPRQDERLVAALLHSIPEQGDRRLAIRNALDVVGARDEHETPARQMSYGMRKRTILAQAAVARPTIALLDEPLAGTDPRTRNLMIDAIQRLKGEERIVLWVEHDIDALTAATDRLLVLDRGTIVADGLPMDVIENQGVRDIYFRPL